MVTDKSRDRIFVRTVTFPHQKPPQTMADPAQLSAAGTAAVLASLLQDEIDNRPLNFNAHDDGYGGGSSGDEGGMIVQRMGGDLDDDRDYPPQFPVAPEEPEPVVDQFLENPPPATGRGSGRGRGRGGRGSGRRAAAAAAFAEPAPVAAQHQAVWGAVNQLLPFEVPRFEGTPGPTNTGERTRTTPAAEMEQLKKTRLFYFEKFIDSTFVHRVVKETNRYVREMSTRERPQWLQARWSWPPKWTAKWKPLTPAVFMRWLALLMFMSLHQTAGESELWSQHWLWERPGIKRLFSRDEHTRIKAALHTQHDGEELLLTALDGKPQLKKIGILLDHMREKCTSLYHPHADISYDEISILMSGRSTLKKQLRFKPIGEGIQFFAFAESRNGSQYLVDFELDRNDREEGKIQKTLLRLVDRLPRNSRNHRIAADNLFNSVDTCRRVAAKGHRIYGTLRLDRGVPHHLRQHMRQMKQKGDCAVVQSPNDELTISAWVDSKVAVCISNVHPPACVLTRRRMKGRTDRVQLPCPLPFAEYNQNMGGIDDFDRLLSFLSVKLRCHKWWHAIFYFLIDVAMVNALHLWRQANPQESDFTSRRVWVAGLIEDIIAKYGDRNGCKWVQEDSDTQSDDNDDRPYAHTGGRGGSKYGMAKASDVVAGTERLEGRHFMVKRENRGICALCYHTRTDKQGQKQVVWMCEQCNVMLHMPECFKEWHTKKKPRSPFV